MCSSHPMACLWVAERLVEPLQSSRYRTWGRHQRLRAKEWYNVILPWFLVLVSRDHCRLENERRNSCAT